MTGSFLAFFGIAVLVIVTPGPDTAITVRNTLLGGRVGGAFTAFGVATGQAIWALATSVGLVALLVASEPVFNALKYAGAAYLVFLGVQALVGAWRGTGASLQATAAAGRASRLSPRAGFVQGLLSDLGNPKMAVFFSSLLPQFAPREGDVFATLILLGLVFSAMTFTWLALYAVAIARIGALLRRSAIRRALDAVMGTVLVALGLRLAAEQR
jgi:threonine/homoserine/homoserine lactone efflux protein